MKAVYIVLAVTLFAMYETGTTVTVIQEARAAHLAQVK